LDAASTSHDDDIENADTHRAIAIDGDKNGNILPKSVLEPISVLRYRSRENQGASEKVSGVRLCYGYSYVIHSTHSNHAFKCA